MNAWEIEGKRHVGLLADVLEPWYEAHRLRYRNENSCVACGHRHGNVHEAAGCAQSAMVTGALADLQHRRSRSRVGLCSHHAFRRRDACNRRPVVPQRVRHPSQLRRSRGGRLALYSRPSGRRVAETASAIRSMLPANASLRVPATS